MKKLLIILLVLIAASCSQPEPEPNQIRFVTANNLPIITAKINDKNAKLLIDTGASISIMDSSVKDKYGFYTVGSNTEVSGIGGTITMDDAAGLVVTYRDSTLRIPFKTADLSHVRRGIGVVGIVGSDWLKRNKAVISYKDNTISLD